MKKVYLILSNQNKETMNELFNFSLDYNLMLNKADDLTYTFNVCDLDHALFCLSKIKNIVQSYYVFQ